VAGDEHAADNTVRMNLYRGSPTRLGSEPASGPYRRSLLVTLQLKVLCRDRHCTVLVRSRAEPALRRRNTHRIELAKPCEGLGPVA